MDVYVGKEFPVVARYATKKVDGTPFFRGQEEEINSVSINKTAITPTNVSAEGDDSSRTYTMDLGAAEFDSFGKGRNVESVFF